MKDSDLIGWYEKLLAADPFAQVLGGALVFLLILAVICGAKALNRK